MVILIYRDEGEEMRVFHFDNLKSAEERAIEVVSDDFPEKNINSISKVRRLEEKERIAVDFFLLTPNESELSSI